MSDKLLILGLGSIGMRHAQNAFNLGLEVIGYDARKLFDVPPRIGWVETIEQGFAHHSPGVIVATPPEMHREGLAVARSFGIPCLVEKPITQTADCAELVCNDFEKANLPLLVGYQLRFHPSLRRLKAQADAGEFGTIYAAHAEFASQKWCSHTYEADILLEASHELDALNWLMGTHPETAFGEQCQEDVWKGQISYYNKEIASFHLDGLHPGYRRSLTLYGTKGVGDWHLDQAENEQAYIDELREFIEVCKTPVLTPTCTGRDGWWAIRMVEAIRRSGETGRWEAV